MADQVAENEGASALPRAFIMCRDEDVSGVSGTGVVAWGVEFPDGVVALRWNSAWPTSVVFHDKGMEAVKAVHGHQGRTRIVWCGYSYTERAWWTCPDCGKPSDMLPCPHRLDWHIPPAPSGRPDRS